MSDYYLQTLESQISVLEENLKIATEAMKGHIIEQTQLIGRYERIAK